ncbi:putative phospholipid-transporting ATPase IH [Portunus trituberculatus]|uniref:Putative phospholipid-transporting ATPase IH n=1 Tax=Portunus trituberculatus TaxID=210409 RepID=A0A5B7HQI4_PORTR|nr:putative phospholipid-transporting ATPase IH [Portunus trituberculatus]
MWYLDYPKEVPVTAKGVYQDSVSFLVIFSYIIPVSLYVTLEMQKFLATLFLQWDEEVSGAGEDEAPKVNTSDLNEELGQVYSHIKLSSRLPFTLFSTTSDEIGKIELGLSEMLVGLLIQCQMIKLPSLLTNAYVLPTLPRYHVSFIRMKTVF